jgi:fused signal recognition particle receptor
MIFWRKKKAGEDLADQNAKNSDISIEAENIVAENEIADEATTADVAILDAVPAVAPTNIESEAIEAVQSTSSPSDLPSVSEALEEVEEASWLSRLTKGLSKSTAKITQNLGDLITKRRLDQAYLDELEETLIMADLGPKTAAKIIEEFSRDRFGKDISGEEIAEALADVIAKILEPVAKPLALHNRADGPNTILVVGVNGVGKTTTIGKIAYDLSQLQNRHVMIAAGDTFRAAAVEQLSIWSQRARCQFFTKEVGADSAAVAFEAYAKAKEAGSDVLMIDTAGRLHSKANLMQELEKIVRVIKKQNETAPHSTLLILDATTGQNAIEQVRVFKEMVNITGLVVTKLDGSAKGGIVVALADQFGLPIHYVGVGETQADLRPFDAKEFSRSLLGIIKYE